MTGVSETIKLLAVIAISLGIMAGWQHYMGLRDAAEQNEHRGGVITTTTGIAQDAGIVDTQRFRVDIGVADARSIFQAQIEEANRYEPETAARADRDVPSSVRDAYRARRLARERFGSRQTVDDPFAAEADAAER